MKNKITRRDLFKRIVKTLPMIALAAIPTITIFASEPMGCKGDCAATCKGLCAVECTAMCAKGCVSTCRGMCHSTCKGSCKVSGKCDHCSDICKGSCTGSCYGSCQNMATGKDSIKFRW